MFDANISQSNSEEPNILRYSMLKIVLKYYFDIIQKE